MESLETKDNKPFWRYIKSQRQEICGVAPLKADRQPHPNASKKVEIPNQQFTSVFTNDDEEDFSGTLLEGPSIPPVADTNQYKITTATCRDNPEILDSKPRVVPSKQGRAEALSTPSMPCTFISNNTQ